MLKNPNEKTELKFQIAFGNLKKDFKDNYYLATEERAVENQIATCVVIAEKENNKYAIVIENIMGVEATRYINLNCFEEWHYVKI